MCSAKDNPVSNFLFPEVEMPDAPNVPLPPLPPDMSSAYNTQADAQYEQNEIAQGQLNLAKKQQGIAEERYKAWQEGYMPLELKALEDARRGISPEQTAGRARNAVMQQGSPVIGAQNRTMKVGRGISADSPAAIARQQAASAGVAAEMGQATTQAREGQERINEARKMQTAGIGANIPGEVVSGYGTTAGIMGAAADTIGQSAQMAAQVQGNLAQMNNQLSMNQYQNQFNTVMNQYQMDVQRAQLEQQAQNQMVQTIAQVGTTAVVKVLMLCIPERTLIDTVQGPIQIEELHVGDEVIGSDGTPCTVLQRHQYLETVQTGKRFLSFVLEDDQVVSACDQHIIDGKPAYEYEAGHYMGGKLILVRDHMENVERSYDLFTSSLHGHGYRIAGVPVASMIPHMAKLITALEGEES